MVALQRNSEVLIESDGMHAFCRTKAFLEQSNVLVSGSKDGYVRAWDLGTQHCFQTVLGQQGEVRLHPTHLCQAL